jgi:gliding motility-associated-like protein
VHSLKQPDFHKAFLFVALFAMASGVMAQAQGVPSSAACACDGQINWQTALQPPLTVSLTGAGGTVVYSESVSSGSGVVTGLCPSVYRIELTSAQAQDIHLVNVPAAGFNPGQAASLSVCSNAAPVSLSAALSGFQSGGSWTNPAGLPDNGNYNAPVESPGLYVYTVTSSGCPVSTGVYVTEIPNSNAGLSTTYLICENYAPFQMTDVLTGNPEDNGSWSYAGGAAIDGWYDPATMSTGMFTYTVPGVPGCESVVSTLYVIENQIPNPGINTNILVCSGGVPFSLTEQMDGDPDTGGTWFGPNNQPVSDLFNPAMQPAGTYRYRVNGQTPCVYQEAYLTITYTSSNPSGENGDLHICSTAGPENLFSHLGGTPVAGGTWTDLNGNPADPVFDPETDSDGVYRYSYPSVGCTPSFAEVSVSVEQPANAGSDQQTELCESVSAVTPDDYLNATATAGGTWTHGGAIVQGDWTIPSPGTYALTYSVTLGVCPPQTSVLTVIVSPLPPALSDVSQVVCSTDPAFDPGELFPEYPDAEFFDGSGNAIGQLNPAALPAPPISVVLESGNICPASTATLIIAAEYPPFADQGTQMIACESDGEFDLTASGFQTDYAAGSWWFGDQAVSNPVPIDFGGIREYRFVTISGQACPPAVLEVEVEVVPIPDAGDDFSMSLCSDEEPVWLAGLISPWAGQGNWFEGDTPLSDLWFNPSQSAGAVYRYVVESGHNCPADEAVISLDVSPQIEVDPGPDRDVCAGSGILSVTTPEQAGYDYSWSGTLNANPAFAPSCIITIPGNVAQPVSHTLVLTATNGICTASGDLVITVHPLPQLDLSGNQSICAGETTLLSVSGAADYAWFTDPAPADPAGPAQLFSPAADQFYTVEGTSAAGCTSVLSGIIAVHPLPVPVFGSPPGEGCQPYSYTASLDPGSQHISQVNWTLNGEQTGTGTEVNWLLQEAGWYDAGISVISEYGCMASLQLDSLIHVLQQTTAHFSFTPENPDLLQPVVQFQDESFQAYTHEWSVEGAVFSSAPSPLWAFPDDEPGVYEICLRTTSSDGCEDTFCRDIQLENRPVFYAPNAFTPDQDGLNEAFRPIYMGYVDNSYLLRIYDRWGMLIFESRDPQEAWYGNVNGGNHFAPNDVYHWQVELKDRETAEHVRFRGHVTLIR